MRCVILILAAIAFPLAAWADAVRIGPQGASAGAITFAVPLAASGLGGPAATSVSPWQQCRPAVRNAGQRAGIPDHLMSAIARVETGRTDPQGVVEPWPWSINVEGTDHVYETKAAAIAAVTAFRASGVRSIDVGCMQVNLLYHPDAFASLDQAFDPAANAAYAARFLQSLFAQTGSWVAATAAYHSANPDLGGPYQRKVQAVLAEEQRRDEAAGAPRMMTAMNAAPVGTGAGAGAGAGAIMLGNRAQSAKLLPMVPGSPQRGLDAYRAAPVQIAGRQIGRLNR